MRTQKPSLGDYSEEVTPVPIPNTVVKLSCADGTAYGRVGRCQAFYNTPCEGCVKSRPVEVFYRSAFFLHP